MGDEIRPDVKPSRRVAENGNRANVEIYERENATPTLEAASR